MSLNELDEKQKAVFKRRFKRRKKEPDICSYTCPDCGEYPEDEYTVNGVNYPIIPCVSDCMGALDWMELHKCSNCKTNYWFNDGT